MNRRNLLSAAAASVMLPGAGMASTNVRCPDISPDADLIAACDEFLRIQREFEAYFDTLSDDMNADDARGSAILNPMPKLVEQIVSLHATTAEGHLARARCTAFHWLPQATVCQDHPGRGHEDRFRAAELRDLVAMERGGRAPVVAAPKSMVAMTTPSPDADLLDACAAFDALERAYIAAGGDYAPGSPEEDASEAERERLYEAQQPLVDRICDVRAVTREGQVARARSLALWDAELMKPQKDTGGWFTQAIVRDLIGEAGPDRC